MSARTVRAALAAAAAFPAGYLLASGLQLPVLAYDPVGRTAFVASSITGVQMRYYGDLLWGALAAAVAAGVALAWPARGRPFNAGALAATALALAALDVAYFLHRLIATP